ncbi:MAG: 5-carboxymethyl-2-hydroxymuconate isomerase [Alphaproteobacteria bacterium]|nr:5-carboxymethyl-2-hydroxymuconate isomerase [Alphaproteobacteria bacterium]
MPQMRIEYSHGVIAAEDAQRLAFDLHTILAPVLDTDLASFKTRLARLDDVAIGQGPSDEAMVHVELGVLSGRSPAIKAQAAELILQRVQAYVERGGSRQPLQMTIEVRDMDADVYRKVTRA